MDDPSASSTNPTPLQPQSSSESQSNSKPPSLALPTGFNPVRPSVSSPASTSAIPMSLSSTPLGPVEAARRPGPPPSVTSSRGSGLNIPQDIQARMKALHLGRQGAPHSSRVNSTQSDGGSGQTTSPSLASPPSGALSGGMSNMRLPNGKPMMSNLHSAPAVPGVRMPPKKPSLADKRGLVLQGGLSGGTSPTSNTPVPGTRKKPGFTLSQMNSGNTSAPPDETKPSGGSMLDRYAEFLDAKTGTLQFKGKATLSAQGVQFADNTSFSISLDEVDTMDELGKGNYGTVYKVRHARPKVRRPGMGLAGNKASHLGGGSNTRKFSDSSMDESTSSLSASQHGTTGAIMAMKEIRLELDDAKFAAIIMELDVLHRCVSPYIIDFYGAFFQEGAVYICMEFMDGGSIDKLYGDGIPENILRKIAYATIMGLKALKEDHNIIHRDVKPTNILMNTKGQIKICDFGVSGNLVASIAKTNIGCQSYMAPERISSGGVAMAGNPGGTYSVQSDIWSLGLSIIECALGRYPYPPETYTNIFSQLSAIVEGDPPDLPKEGYSEAARNFVHGCLNKIPKLRPTYPMLLQHIWMAPLVKPAIIEEEEEEDEQPTPSTTNDSPTSTELATDSIILPHDVVDPEIARWVIGAVERRRQGKMGKSAKPALHAAPLDAVSTPETGPMLKKAQETAAAGDVAEQSRSTAA